MEFVDDIAGRNVEAQFKLTRSMGKAGRKKVFCLDVLESGGLLSTKDQNQALQMFMPSPAFKL